MEKAKTATNSPQRAPGRAASNVTATKRRDLRRGRGKK